MRGERGEGGKLPPEPWKPEAGKARRLKRKCFPGRQTVGRGGDDFLTYGKWGVFLGTWDKKTRGGGRAFSLKVIPGGIRPCSP